MNQPSPATDPEKENRLNAIIVEYLKRKDAGQKVSKEALLKSWPDLADGLRSYFAGEAMMDAGAPAFAPTRLSPKPTPGDSRETMRPGAIESDTASEFTSKTFGRYQLLRPLGEGAMGSVYLALDTTLDRQVALKVPKTAGTSNAEFMARFTREAKAAAALKHANICSVYDAGEFEGTAYITMDYIDGVPLSRFIGSRKLQSVDSILQMITIIAEAVGHAHSKGVIHRDLKPGNILVDADFKPHVTDFGLARRTGPADESRITQEGLLIGTPAYMAPEQVKGEQAKVGPESDIYSLGVILFELLTSRLPFEGKVAEMLAKVLRDNPPVPSRIRKDLSEDIDDICLKMLRKEPKQRYSSMAEVVAAIAKLPKKTVPIAAVSADAARAQSPFEIQKAHVEVMLKKGQYAAAIQELEKLGAEKSPAAKAVGEWARVTLPIARAESKALSPAGLAALLQTGQQMFEKSDYLGCIQLLDDVPSLRRTEAMEDLLAKARKRETDAEQLLSEIKDKERRQEIDGLEPLVKRFLKLKPGNTYAKRLWEALQTYSKTPATRRNYHYEKGRLQPMPEPSLFQQWVVLGLLVGVLTFLSVSYYVIIYLKSGNQTLAVHVDDDWLKSQGGELTLVVDGDTHTITAPSSGGEPLTVTVTLGEHTFSVKHGDTVVHDPQNFQIEKDGRKILSITATDIRLEHGVPAPQPASEMGVADNDGPAVISESNAHSDWITLFDGSDVSRWSTLGPYAVQDGLLVANNGQSQSAAVSKEEYADFELEAEWRLGVGTNGGIYYRELPTTGGAGNEYQLIDPAHPQLSKASQKTAALYGIVAPSEDAERPVGDWNMTKIVCCGSNVEHWLNGKKIVQYDTSGSEWKDLIAGSEIKSGKERIGTQSRGYILLQSQTGELAFRSIRIRGLTLSDVSSSAASTANNTSPLLAVAPFNADTAKRLQEDWASEISTLVETTDSVGITLRLISPGEFLMGSPEAEPFRKSLEGPQHRVRISQPFYMGRTEVTQAQWAKVMGTRPWHGQPNITEGDEYPATYVNRNEVVEFCRKLSAQQGYNYRLPSEAEWEFACRAGTTTAWYFGDDVQQLQEYAWFDSNTLQVQKSSAQLVGQKKPNPFGLFDMHGNVFEWCEDFFYAGSAYPQRTGVTVDPVANGDGDAYSTRGGGWDWNGYDIRSALRGASVSEFRSERDGFRVVRNVNKNVSSADTTSAASDLDSIATGVWKPLVDSNTVLSNPEKMKFQNGILELETSLVLSQFKSRDVIVRAEVRKISGQNVGITIRHSPGTEWKQAYAGWFNGTQSDGGDLFGIAKAMRTSVSLSAGHSGHKFEPDQFVDMAVAAIGDQISLYVEGKKILSATDADYGAGAIVFGVYRGKGLFRNIRYQSLDSPNGNSAEQPMAAPSNTDQKVDVPDPNPQLKNISQVHGATAEELADWTKSLPQGFRPYWVSVRSNSQPVLFDALAAMPLSQHEWILQTFDAADDGTIWKSRIAEYRPAFLSIYPKGSGHEKLVLWIKDNRQWEYWLGGADFMAEKLEEGLKWDQADSGFRERWLPVSLVANDFEGSAGFEMLQAYVPYHECEWALDLSAEDLSAKVSEYRARGWRPAIVNTIHGSNPSRCFAVFGNNEGQGKWSFSPGLSVSEYRSLLSTADAAGGKPQCLFSRVENDQIIYSVIWDGVEF